LDQAKQKKHDTKNTVGPAKLIDINNKTTQRTPVEDRYTRYLDFLIESKPTTPLRAALSVHTT